MAKEEDNRIDGKLSNSIHNWWLKSWKTENVEAQLFADHLFVQKKEIHEKNMKKQSINTIMTKIMTKIMKSNAIHE